MPPKLLTNSEAHELNACNKFLILNLSREHTIFSNRKIQLFLPD